MPLPDGDQFLLTRSHQAASVIRVDRVHRQQGGLQLMSDSTPSPGIVVGVDGYPHP